MTSQFPPPYPYGMLGVPQQPRPGIAAFGLGLAGLIIGIIAATFIWIPLCGLLAWPIATVGLLLAMAGVIVSLATGRRQKLGMPLAGFLVCAAALITGLISYQATKVTPGKVVANLERYEQEQAAQKKAEADAEQAFRDSVPPYTIESNFGDSLGINGPVNRYIDISASGDLTAENLEKILDHFGRRYNIANLHIGITARTPKPVNGVMGYLVASRTGTLNSVNDGELQRYRQAAGYDRPTTSPTTVPAK